MIPILARRKRCEAMRFLRYMTMALVQYLLERGEDPEEISMILKEIGKRMAERVYMDIRQEYKKEIVGYYDLIDDLYNSMRKYLCREPERVSILFKPSERRVTIWVEIKSPLCEAAVVPVRNLKLGSLLAGIIEWIQENRKEMFGVRSVIVEETKCQAVGDDVDELKIVFELTDEGVRKAEAELEAERKIVVK